MRNPYLFNLWLRSAGKDEDWTFLEPPGSKPPLSHLQKSETEPFKSFDEKVYWAFRESAPHCSRTRSFFNELLRYADARMVMGAFRYGTHKAQAASGRVYDYDAAFRRRMELFRTSHLGTNNPQNLEHVVDAYNMARLGWLRGQKAFKASLPHFKMKAAEAAYAWRMGRKYGLEVHPVDDGEHTKSVTDF